MKLLYFYFPLTSRRPHTKKRYLCFGTLLFSYHLLTLIFDVNVDVFHQIIFSALIGIKSVNVKSKEHDMLLVPRSTVTTKTNKMLSCCLACKIKRLVACLFALLLFCLVTQLFAPCLFFFNKTETCRKTNTVNKQPTEEIDLDLQLSNPRNRSNWRDVQYHLNNESRCSGKDIFLLIFVHSAPSHAKERQHIRDTWASVMRYAGRNTNTVFMLARPSSPTMQQHLVAESKAYGDIIQGDFIDHYRNLTRKHIMAYKWTLTYCRHVKFIVKVDDDTLINIYRTLVYLVHTYPQGYTTNLLYCSVYYRQHAVRRKSDKWYVSYDEYPHERYPDYCEGFAYIVTPDVMQKLYAMSFHTEYYWIDDVYVTGMLTNRTRVIAHPFRSPYGYDIMSRKHTSVHEVNEALFLLAKYDKSDEMWLAVWDAAEKSNMESVKSRYHIVSDDTA